MSILINDMYFDSSGGVDLKKNYSYYTYDDLTSETGYTSINIFTGEYVSTLKNINDNYSIDIEDDGICLQIETGTTISAWTINYINSYVTTGYSEQYITEDRVLYSLFDNNFYKIAHTGSTTHQTDTSELWAIIDQETNTVWTGGTNYSYQILDNCGNKTNIYKIKLKNINENSDTNFQIKYYLKTLESNNPIIITYEPTGITQTGATFIGTIEPFTGETTIEQGFCYSIFSNPTITDMKETVTPIIGDFLTTVSELIPNTTYYVRAYLININGTFFGNEITFKTLE